MALATRSVPATVSSRPHAVRRCAPVVRAAASTQAIVVKTPTDAERAAAAKWPTWGCEVSVFPWSYAEAETCLVLQGRVLVTPDGGEAVEVKAGDMATFPAGLSCVWDVKEAIRKHYNFH